MSWVTPAFPAIGAAFKMMNAILLGLGAVLVARFARKRVLEAGWALALGAVTAVSIPILIVGGLVLSEPFYFAILVALLPGLESLVDQPSTARRALLLGAGIGACVLVRTNGIVLLRAMVLAPAAGRRWRDGGLVAAGAMVCLLPWQLWRAAQTGALRPPLRGNYESYTSWWIRGLAQMGVRMVPETLRMTMPETGAMFAAFSPIGGPLRRAVALAAAPALAVGGGRATLRRISVPLLFLAAHLSL